MKKLLVVLSAALALSASAKLEKVVTVQVADVADLTAAVTRLGEHVGNPMLSSFAVAGLAQNPLVEAFGPSRDRLPFALSLYVDPKIAVACVQGDEKARQNDDCVEFSLTYAATKTEKELVEAFGDPSKTNGYLTIESLPLGCCLRFSGDGKWVTCASKPTVLEDGLKDSAAAEKKMGGDFLRVSVTPKGVKLVRAILLAIEKLPADSPARKDLEIAKLDFADLAYFQRMLANFESARLGVRCDARGLDSRVTAKIVKGSELDGDVFLPIKGRPLAFANAGEVFALEEGENNGSFCIGQRISDVLAAVRQCGLKTDSIKADRIDAGHRLTLDFAELGRYLTQEGTNDLARLDSTNYCNKVKAAWYGDKKGFTMKAPASRVGLVVKGAKAAPAADRFEKLLPEAKGKPVCEAS